MEARRAIRSKLIAPPFYDGDAAARIEARCYSPEASMRADEDFIISGDLSVPTCRLTRLYGAFIFQQMCLKDCLRMYIPNGRG